MRWTEVDRGLAEGLLAYEASLDEHGFPSWIARDSEQKFAPDEFIDHAAAAFEANQKAVRKAGNEPSPGTRVIVKHMGPRTSPESQIQDQPEE
jgi:hypothetical protein